MKLEIPNVGMHNEYNLQVRDTITGQIKQDVTFTNITLKKRYTNTTRYSYTCGLNTIHLGDGRVEPTFDDTALTHELFYCINDYKDIDDSVNRYTNTIQKIRVYTIPASSNYVGKITEIGISDDYSTFYTHALLKDTEGNIIEVNKTDVDELIITVIFRLCLDRSDNFYWLLDKPVKVYSADVAIPYFLNAFFACGCYFYDNLDMASIACYGVNNSPTYVGNTYTRQARIPNTCKIGYVNSIGICFKYNSLFDASAAWNIPGHMPHTTITNMEVGTGDGATTEFEPPLDFWVKDTDKVYVSGVLLNRGVDYTIDNCNNRNRRKEITPGNFVKKCQGATTIVGGRPADGVESTVPFCYCYSQAFVTEKEPDIYLELDDTQPTFAGINYWSLGLWTKYHGLPLAGVGGDADIDDVVFNLYNSEDGETYDLVDTYSYSDKTCGTPRTIPFTTRKYWKISVDMSKCYPAYTPTSTIWSCSTWNTGVEYESKLGYYGSPIVFTTPPAADAIITMTADLDRPFMNGNFFIDAAIEVPFG